MLKGFALVLVLAIPILFWVALIWASAIIGLLKLTWNATRRGAAICRTLVAKAFEAMAKEPLPWKTTHEI